VPEHINSIHFTTIHTQTLAGNRKGATMYLPVKKVKASHTLQRALGPELILVNRQSTAGDYKSSSG